MKALSIKQPWAYLIANGYKDIENRSWSTNFRGEFLIHAGATFDVDWQSKLNKSINISIPEDLDKGGIVGKAEIVDCVTESDSPWFNGEYGFVMRNAQPLPFIPLKGQLQFFNVDDSILKGGSLIHPRSYYVLKKAGGEDTIWDAKYKYYQEILPYLDVVIQYNNELQEYNVSPKNDRGISLFTNKDKSKVEQWCKDNMCKGWWENSGNITSGEGINSNEGHWNKMVEVRNNMKIHPKSYLAGLVGIDNPLTDYISEDVNKNLGQMFTSLGDRLESIGDSFISIFPELSFFIGQSEGYDDEYYIQIRSSDLDLDNESFSDMETEIIEALKESGFNFSKSSDDSHGYFITFEL